MTTQARHQHPARIEAPQRGADVFQRTLSVLGVPFVPGNYGVTEIGFTTAAERNGGVQPLLVYQEMVAAGMAQGYAYATGRPLVVFAHGTLGFGAMSALVFNLKQDGVPGVFVIGTAGNLAGSMMQTQDPDGLSATIKIAEGAGAKQVFIATDPVAIPKLLKDAWEKSIGGKPGPVVVVIPDEDVMRKAVPDGTVDIKLPKPVGSAFPDPEAIAAIVATLQRAKTPVMVVGNELGRSGARAIVAAERLADAIGAHVFGLMENYLAFPRTSPLFVGQAGAVAHAGWPAIMREADALLYVGTHSDQMAVFPGATGPYSRDVQVFLIGTDPDLAVRAYEGQHVFASPAPALEAILAALECVNDDGFRREAAARAARIAKQTRTARTRQLESARREAAMMPLHPIEFADALAAALKGVDVLVMNEGIGYADFFEHALQPAVPGMYFAGRGGALGVGGPIGIGLAAATGKAVMVISGDGAYNYTPQWMMTAREQGFNVIEIVLKNDEYRFLDVAIDHIVSASGADPALFPHPAVHQLARDRRTGARLNFDYTKQAEAYDTPAISISERAGIPDVIAFIQAHIGKAGPALVQLVIRHPGPPV